MKYLLATENVVVMQQFAWSKVLAPLYFDGTLATHAGYYLRTKANPLVSPR